MASLGPRWSFRVLVVPGAPLVTSGPYRWMRHPNYVGVMGELAGVAIALSAFITGTLALVTFAWILVRRIKVEERALYGPAGGADGNTLRDDESHGNAPAAVPEDRAGQLCGESRCPPPTIAMNPWCSPTWHPDGYEPSPQPPRGARARHDSHELAFGSNRERRGESSLRRDGPHPLPQSCSDPGRGRNPCAILEIPCGHPNGRCVRCGGWCLRPRSKGARSCCWRQRRSFPRRHSRGRPTHRSRRHRSSLTPNAHTVPGTTTSSNI